MKPSVLQGRPLHSRGQYFLLSAPLDTINIHLREGHIIPQQVGPVFWQNCTCIDTEKGKERCLIVLLVLPFKEPALTTTASRTNPFSLTVALSAGGWAWGDLFWDDGDGLHTFETGNYSYIVFVAGEVWNTRQLCFRGFSLIGSCVSVCECLLQSQVVSEPLAVSEALAGLVLGGLQVFGLQSTPIFVLANGQMVMDFTYCSELKVSALLLSTAFFA